LRSSPEVEALNLVEETVDVGGLTLSILRPRQAEALLSEEAFEHEEFLPYWAELWPSGIALARVVRRRDMNGLRVLELGCGLGLPSIVAALGGAQVLATDWSPEGLEVAELNAARNHAEVETALVSWAGAERLVHSAPWDLVLGADLLYERRNVDQLLSLLPRLGGEVLLAEPGRPPAARFFEQVELDVEPLGDRIYRLTVPAP
jgi:predicted nicotinamide N-methyase